MQANYRPDLHFPESDDIEQKQPASAATLPPCSDTPLVFVTGASRSGTTMLARMLGAHSSTFALNELHYFGSLWEPGPSSERLPEARLVEFAATLLARQERGLWSGRPTAAEERWGKDTVRQMPADECTPGGLFSAAVSRMAADKGKRIACEQTPRNIFYAQRLLSLYPHARVVHIVRDPRGVLASQKNRWRLRSLGADHLPRAEMIRNRVNYHPFTISKLWQKATAEALRLQEHPRLMIIRFEDLAADPEAGTRRVCDFLSLELEQAMLELPRWGSSNVQHTTTNTGVSREVVDKWREVLSAGEILMCERVTRKLMQQLGYPSLMLERRSSMAMLPSILTYPLHAAGVVALNPGRAWIQLKAVMGR